MEPLLTVENLRKVYKDAVAVKDVSFRVWKGSCFGLLGPNGAGKTTTIEIIEDIISPTAGAILFKGKQRAPSFREEIGIQFQHTSLLNYLSVEETLNSFAQLFASPVNIHELMERCGLTGLKDRRNTKLSGGQLQRLMLALALINDPELIFLDEPSTGLDPQSRRNLWSLVEDIKSHGKTIIMTTHSMEEAERLCDRIAIMDEGSIIADGTPEELIRTHCPESTLTLPSSYGTHIRVDLDGKIERNGESLRIRTAAVGSVLEHLSDRKLSLAEVNLHSPTLEDVFLKLTGKSLRD